MRRRAAYGYCERTSRKVRLNGLAEDGNQPGLIVAYREADAEHPQKVLPPFPPERRVLRPAGPYTSIGTKIRIGNRGNPETGEALIVPIASLSLQSARLRINGEVQSGDLEIMSSLEGAHIVASSSPAADSQSLTLTLSSGGIGVSQVIDGVDAAIQLQSARIQSAALFETASQTISTALQSATIVATASFDAASQTITTALQAALIEASSSPEADSQTLTMALQSVVIHSSSAFEADGQIITTALESAIASAVDPDTTWGKGAWGAGGWGQ